MALVQTHLTQAEWHALDKDAHYTPKDQLFALPWVLRCLPEPKTAGAGLYRHSWDADLAPCAASTVRTPGAGHLPLRLTRLNMNHQKPLRARCSLSQWVTGGSCQSAQSSRARSACWAASSVSPDSGGGQGEEAVDRTQRGAGARRHGASGPGAGRHRLLPGARRAAAAEPTRPTARHSGAS